MADTIEHSIVVQGMVEDLFNLWANFDNFPRFMKNIKSITRTGERNSHWVMQGPLGTSFEWEAETTRFEPNRAIAWNSKDNSPLKTSGLVTFEELATNQTEIRVRMHYDPPAGAAGEVLAELFANPEARLREDLQRFKEFVESTTNRLHDVDPTEQTSQAWASQNPPSAGQTPSSLGPTGPGPARPIEPD